MLSKNSSLVFKFENYDSLDMIYMGNREMDRIFYRILSEELEASEGIVHEVIADLVKDEFKTAVCKKWEIFMNDIADKMRTCNNRRKKWA